VHRHKCLGQPVPRPRHQALGQITQPARNAAMYPSDSPNRTTANFLATEFIAADFAMSGAEPRCRARSRKGSPTWTLTGQCGSEEGRSAPKASLLLQRVRRALIEAPNRMQAKRVRPLERSFGFGQAAAMPLRAPPVLPRSLPAGLDAREAP